MLKSKAEGCNCIPVRPYPFDFTLQHSALSIQNCYIPPMPIGTAVHERTFALCESLNYREWSGYYAVSAYESHHEHEYNAIRNAAALIDVSPLFKYLVTGRTRRGSSTA